MLLTVVLRHVIDVDGLPRGVAPGWEMRQHATNRVVGVGWTLVFGSVPCLALGFVFFPSLSTYLKVQTYTHMTDGPSRMLLGPGLIGSCSPTNCLQWEVMWTCLRYCSQWQMKWTHLRCSREEICQHGRDAHLLAMSKRTVAGQFRLQMLPTFCEECRNPLPVAWIVSG